MTSSETSELRAPTVRLGDVARRVSYRHTPNPDVPERWIGADQLDEEDLRVRRWNLTDDPMFPPTFKFRFDAGAVLIHSRNPKKVAIADFQAITGEKLFALGPVNPSILDPRFLALQLQSRSFERFVGRWLAGSVNKFLNWTALERYEFALPPLDEQKRIIDLLGTAKEVVEQHRRALAEHERLLEVFIHRSFGEWRTSCTPVAVPSIGALQMGRQKAPKYETGVGTTSYLRVANIGHLRMDLSALEAMDFAPDERTKYGLKRGDVLITEGDIVSVLNVGRPAIFPGAKAPVCFQNTLIRLRPREEFDSHFVMGLIEGARLHGVLAAAASTTTVSHLGLRRLSAVTLPVPNRSVRDEFAAYLEALLGFGECLAEAAARQQSVLQALRGEVLR